MREEARFDRPQDEAVVAEELLALGGETTVELARLVELESREAVVGGAQEDDQLQVLVAAHRPAHVLDLVARLTLEVEDLLDPVVDLDQRASLVVLGDSLAALRRGAELELARARLVRLEADPRHHRLAGGREAHFLRAHDPPVVHHLEIDHLAGVSGLLQRHLDHQGRAAQDATRRFHPAHLHVAIEALAADADRVDRHAAALELEDGVVERLARVVGAVGERPPGPRGGPR